MLPMLLLPGSTLPPPVILLALPECTELEEGLGAPPVEDDELLLLLLDDLLDALLLRCFAEDDTPLPLLLPAEIPALELAFKTLLLPPALPLLLVIFMIVAEVVAEFMVESISFSGDEHESEEVSC